MLIRPTTAVAAFNNPVTQGIKFLYFASEARFYTQDNLVDTTEFIPAYTTLKVNAQPAFHKQAIPVTYRSTAGFVQASGYVSIAAYLQPRPLNFAELPISVRVIVPRLLVHQYIGVTAPVVGSADYGTVLTVTDLITRQGRNWYAVSGGWAQALHLSPL